MIFGFLLLFSIAVGIAFFVIAVTEDAPLLWIGVIIMIILIAIFASLADNTIPSCIIMDVEIYEEYDIFYNIYKEECTIKGTGEKYIEYELVILE